MDYLIAKQKKKNSENMNIMDDDENISDDELNETDPSKSFHHSDIMMPEILYGKNT